MTSFFYCLFILLLIALSLPLQFLVVILIAITSGFPVVYSQRRTGKNGKTFLMYKFRTMVKGAHGLQNKFEKLNEADGPVFKIRDDPRFTRIGKFLSHTGLDELPQLWNVVRGDMALIGPRPLPVAEASKLAPWMRKRHDVLPGIISPWILNGYHRQSFREWMKSDVSYAKHKSVSGDIRLFFCVCRLMARLFISELKRAS
ncbi:sugar transferase [Patescibacteria group bacterium]|nr:sugar transferase [Patescibacteria group bacterium]MBU1472498.1 sugar transferase [Patescibacteria group bacterium]MBU2459545.1 sugar transferase [Patescibacteria group bacterium]MBU2543866.1 sugar transferase [Patescibacteria group bacterium]